MTPTTSEREALVAELRRLAKDHEVKADRPHQDECTRQWHMGMSEAYDDAADKLAALTRQEAQQEAQGAVAWLTPQQLSDLRQEKPWTAGAFGEFSQRKRDEYTVPLYAATPPAPVDVRKVKALLDDHSAGKLHSDQFVQAISALYELALLDGQPAGVDAAIKSVRDAELFADGVAGDLHCMGINTLAAAYMEGRQQALNELQAALGGGVRS